MTTLASSALRLEYSTLKSGREAQMERPMAAEPTSTNPPRTATRCITLILAQIALMELTNCIRKAGIS